MNSKDEPHYGDACFVGHTGAVLYLMHYTNYQTQFLIIKTFANSTK
jgi:hypothetical protein